MPILKIEKLTKKYGKTYALNKIERRLCITAVKIVKRPVKIGVHNRKHPHGVRVHLLYFFKPIGIGGVRNIRVIKVGKGACKPHINALNIKKLRFLPHIAVKIAVFICKKGKIIIALRRFYAVGRKRKFTLAFFIYYRAFTAR